VWRITASAEQPSMTQTATTGTVTPHTSTKAAPRIAAVASVPCQLLSQAARAAVTSRAAGGAPNPVAPALKALSDATWPPIPASIVHSLAVSGQASCLLLLQLVLPWRAGEVRVEGYTAPQSPQPGRSSQMPTTGPSVQSASVVPDVPSPVVSARSSQELDAGSVQLMACWRGMYCTTRVLHVWQPPLPPPTYTSATSSTEGSAGAAATSQALPHRSSSPDSPETTRHASSDSGLSSHRCFALVRCCWNAGAARWAACKVFTDPLLRLTVAVCRWKWCRQQM
jgi:hypothetical protein